MSHGSLALVLGSDGTPLEHLYYEPFGGRTDVTGASVGAPTTGVPWGFAGHEEDNDLGLINMGGRVYDPVLRRFLSPDPIVHNLLAGQTLNHYSYVWNNPLRYVDPSGLDGETTTVIPYTISDEGGYTEHGQVFIVQEPADTSATEAKKQILPGPADPGVVGAPQADEGSQPAQPVLPYVAAFIPPALEFRPPSMDADVRRSDSQPGVGSGLTPPSASTPPSSPGKEPDAEDEPEQRPWYKNPFARTVGGSIVGVALPLLLVPGTVMFGVVAGAGKLPALAPLGVGAPKPDLGRRWKPLDINDEKSRSGCEAMARKIQKRIGGTIHTIRPKADPSLGEYRNKTWKWFHHDVVVRDGRVYDGFGPRYGLGIEDFKKLWQEKEAIDFGF